MSIDNKLIAGEKIVFKFEWHWVQLILPIFSCISIIGIVWLIYMLIYFNKSKVVLTNRRLLGTFGLVPRTKIDIPLDKIDSFGVIQTHFLSILNAGKIFFYSEGEKYTMPILTKDSKLLENWFSESKHAFIRQLNAETGYDI